MKIYTCAFHSDPALPWTAEKLSPSGIVELIDWKIGKYLETKKIYFKKVTDNRLVVTRGEGVGESKMGPMYSEGWK